MDTSSRTGLFVVQYDITTGHPGAPVLHLALTVNTVDRAVSGAARITQAINPPLDVRSMVHGSFTYMTVMPHLTHILLVATGYPAIEWPSHGGIGPVLLPNLHLRAVLDKGWDTGTANFRYEASGKWVDIENAKVSISGSTAPIHTLYGVVVHEAAASGDLARMKQVAAQAEQHISQTPAVQSALAALKAEIAKAESKG